ncbi:hypothetical protein P171DRAFT_439724 [Karstenula rhodostoma CBS 690.94]|uniref:Uncharacterized protein n=1 Tax=Karstenula rhodostoma CBS 690.94 TaxID=1392251 RepID=A0A9P4PUG1_9PLEO|nr:hypothetical protein P171DRAFT_439724 [Karstenula rhodostoma CBS 690.94]
MARFHKCEVPSKVQGFQATGATSETVEKIHFFAHLYYLPLQTFLTKLRKLEPELGNEATFNNTNASTSARDLLNRYVKRPVRQVQWAIQLKKHVSELKAAIGPQLETITILLQLVNCKRQAELHDDHAEFVLRIQALQESTQTHNDNINTYLTDIAASVSADVANQVSERLNIRFGCLNAEITSRLESTGDQPDATRETWLRGSGYQERSAATSIELVQEGVQILFLRFCMLMSFVRTAMQYTKIISRLPTALLSDNIRFEDALGRVVSLQYSWPA